MKRLALLLLPVLAACSSWKPSMPDMSSLPSMPDFSSWVTPYRIDIRQGNYVSQDMIAKLKKGMTKDQVRFVLGTPLLKDLFHDNRWDYVYLFQPGKGKDKGKSEERRISVFFDQEGKLASLGGDVVPMTNTPDKAKPAEGQKPVEPPKPVEAPKPAAPPASADAPKAAAPATPVPPPKAAEPIKPVEQGKPLPPLKPAEATQPTPQPAKPADAPQPAATK